MEKEETELITTEVKTSSKDSKCRVCRKQFCEPKLLPCGHLMCRKCLLSWLKQTRHATCPYCRYPILKDDKDIQAVPVTNEKKEEIPPEGDKGMDDEQIQTAVDGFPTELFMQAFVKAKQLLSQKKHNCTACEESATSLCLQCGDTLCTPCKKVHSRLTVSRNHVVEELSSLTAERLADFQSPTPCPQHPDEPCRLFCPQHDTSLCLLCASSRHRSCTQVKEFEEQVEEAKTKLAEIIKVMTDGTSDLDGVVTELDQHLADIETRTETALADIQTLNERLTRALENCIKRLEQKVTEAREDIRQAVKEAKAVLLGRQARLGSHTALAQRVHQSKVRDVVCGMTSVMAARLEVVVDPNVDLSDEAKVVTTATLDVDKNAIVRIEQELARLGEVKVVFAPVSANVYGGFHTNHGQYITLSNGAKTATRTSGNNGSIVVVKTPMDVGELIEVKIDQWVIGTRGNTGFPILGVTTQSPDALNLKTCWSNQLGLTMVIASNGGFISGAHQAQYVSVGQHLQSVVQGSRVGVYLDASRGVHLYIDGQDKGVFASNVAQPCYALFDVCDFAKQVTLLRRRRC